MGDLQVSSLPRPSGVLFSKERQYPLPASSPLPASNPDPALIGVDSWKRAEMTTHGIVSLIQPTQVADQKRKDIIEYVQRLIRRCIVCEVFPYGSVPLKTYLPEGDIDLTAFTGANADDALVSDVHGALRGEELNESAQYKVKDVHCIDAEVKLVKCIVQDVVVDISFNQLGGLSTLCFLEQVDRLTGKDHLFKRSIILIKAWCYYESRTLGAHHGLISTYALETLVLYIFHLFHTSLNGPLAVLFRFLDYFSKFDWENYCISLKGPVRKSSLPDILAEVPEDEMDDPLLSEEFLRKCQDMFSVSSNGLETNLRVFPLKHLNIIDPLKENNNLGRSVNRGNFYRIRCAFKYGARKLGSILMLPGERIADELKKFFANTLDRHGGKFWKNMQDSTVASGVKVSDYMSYPLGFKTFPEQKNLVEFATGFEIKGIEVASGLNNKQERHLVRSVSSQIVPEFGHYLHGDVKQPAASGIVDTRCSNDLAACFPAIRCLSSLIPICSHQAPHSYTFLLQSEDGNIDNWSPCKEELVGYSATDVDMSFNSSLEHKDKDSVMNDVACSCSNQEVMTFTDSTVLSDVTNFSKNVDHLEKDNAGIFGSCEAFKFLLDLCGDYDSHLRNLHYGQLCHVYATSPQALPSPPLSPLLQNKNPWEPIRKSIQFQHIVYPQSSKSGVALRPQCYPANSFSFPCTAFGEENKKPRGTGTYFANLNGHPYRDRRLTGTGRIPVLRAHVPLQTHAHSNGFDMAPQELTTAVECRHELSHADYPVLGSGKTSTSDYHQSNLSVWESFYASTFSSLSEKLEPGSSCPQKTCESPLPEGVNPSIHTCALASTMQNSESISARDQDRVKEQAYHLKNEDDFPPLSAA